MRFIFKFLLLSFSLVLFVSCELSSFNGGAGFGISWTPPVERENGDKLLAYEIGGYEISYRKVGTVAYTSVIVEKPGSQEYHLPVMSAGNYEVRIAAFDTNGLYSRFSDPAFFKVP